MLSGDLLKYFDSVHIGMPAGSVNTMVNNRVDITQMFKRLPFYNIRLFELISHVWFSLALFAFEKFPRYSSTSRSFPARNLEDHFESSL